MPVFVSHDEAFGFSSGELWAEEWEVYLVVKRKGTDIRRTVKSHYKNPGD